MLHALTLWTLSHAFAAAPSAVQAPKPPPTSSPAAQLQGLGYTGGSEQGASAPVLDHRAVQLALARLASEYPELATVLPVGISRGGRRIDALRVAHGNLEPGRPAILVVASLDGPLAWTSSIAIELAQRLTAGYASDTSIKALLDTTTFYIVPRANPDAAEARFAVPLLEVRATFAGGDDDRDGRTGEDGPADVDGDGQVLTMRKLDPEGEWMVDPTDERALVKADRRKGQRGIYKLYPEGRDSDLDEKVGEDALLDVVVNRNFPQGWVEHAPESGAFATSEPEARALCEFVLASKDIALALTYGTLDNLVEKPKTKDDAGRRSANPSEGIPAADVEVLAEIGQRYSKITKSKAKGDGKDGGTFQAWVQAQRGLWTLNVMPWSMPLDEPAPKKEGENAESAAGDAKIADSKDAAAKAAEDKPEEPRASSSAAASPPAQPQRGAGRRGPGGGARGADSSSTASGKDEGIGREDDAKRLRWIDAKQQGARFVAWHAFTHPELGAVEIGGFTPYALLEPPEADRAEIARLETDFALTLGDILPRVKLVEVSAKDLGRSQELLGGLWRIEAVVVNDALLPFMSALGRRTDVVRPARVRLVLPKDGQLQAGERQELLSELPGMGGRKELKWLVSRAPAAAVTIEVDTANAGSAKVRPEVK